MIEGLVAALPCLLAVATGLAAQLTRNTRQSDRRNIVGATLTAAAAFGLAIRVLAKPNDLLDGSWYSLDPIGAVFLGVIAVVGLMTALVSTYQHSGE